MKKNNFILFAFIFLFVSEVINSQSKMTHLPIFDISKEHSQKKLYIQDIAEIEYIPLETTDDVLISDRAVFSAVSDNYILLHEPMRGDIYIFDRFGKLYSHFNNRGQSGQEYVWIKGGTILDEKAQEIFVCSQSIQVYSLKGEYKRTLKINTTEFDRTILNFNDKSLLIYDDVIVDPGFENKTKKTPYRLVSKKDGSLNSFLNIQFSKRYSSTIAKVEGKMWHPILCYYPRNPYYGANIMIADISSDTLYQLSSDKGLIPILTRKPSVHASEPRNVWTTYVTTDKFILIGMVLLDFNSKGGEIPVWMYEFETGETSQVSILDAEYMKTKSSGTWGPKASPSITKNKVAELIQASAVIKAYKDKRLKGNGDKIAKTLHEDDNPVVRIITFK